MQALGATDFISVSSTELTNARQLEGCALPIEGACAMLPSGVYEAMRSCIPGSILLIWRWLASYWTPLATIFLSVAVVVVTYLQSRTAREALRLEWRAEIYAVIENEVAEVTNLARSTALLLGFRVRPSRGKESLTLKRIHKAVVRPESSVTVDLRRHLNEYFQPSGRFSQDIRLTGNEPFEVSFSFYCAGKTHESDWFEFSAQRRQF